jgi:hypothetical protein
MQYGRCVKVGFFAHHSQADTSHKGKKIHKTILHPKTQDFPYLFFFLPFLLLSHFFLLVDNLSHSSSSSFLLSFNTEREMVCEKERRPMALLAVGLAVTHGIAGHGSSHDPRLARPTTTLFGSPSLAGSSSSAPTIIFFGIRVIKSSRVNIPLLGFRFNPKMIFVALETNFRH